MLQILKMQQMVEQAEKKENEGEEDTKVIKIGSSVTKNNIYLLS